MPRNFLAFDKAREFHARCRRLKLPGYLRDQLLRASCSIALNLAEGSARFTDGDQKRYYGSAYSSIVECEAILALLERPEPELESLLWELGAITYKLARRPKKNTTPDTI